jgi:hypothetical protein
MTAYSISYDIFTLPNERDSPLGWHSPRCNHFLNIAINVLTLSQANIYRQLKAALLAAGFIRNQYSVWVHPFISATNTYTAMLGLEGIVVPPNKLSSTVKGLRMSRLDNFALMDVTPDIQIGGAAVLSLLGPVPAGLVPAPAALVPPAVPIPAGFPFALPVDSRAGPGVNNPATFLI